MGLITDGVFAWLGQNEQSKASKRAAAASQDATDKTLGFLRETRDQTRQDNALSRFYGDQALGRLGGLMGIGAPAPNALQQQQPFDPYSAYVEGNPDVMSAYRSGQFGQMSMADAGRYHFGAHGQGEGRQLPTAPQMQPQTQPVQQSPTDWLRSTPGYQFNLDEGNRQMAAALAKSGLSQSGSAVKRAGEFGQNYADRIFNQERNALFNLAGYGQVANQNNQQAGQQFAAGAGNALQNNAAALGSSYMARGNAKAGMWGGLHGSLNSYGNMAARMMMGG